MVLPRARIDSPFWIQLDYWKVLSPNTNGHTVEEGVSDNLAIFVLKRIFGNTHTVLVYQSCYGHSHRQCQDGNDG